LRNSIVAGMNDFDFHPKAACGILRSFRLFDLIIVVVVGQRYYELQFAHKGLGVIISLCAGKNM
jgi:hypothetical protein